MMINLHCYAIHEIYHNTRSIKQTVTFLIPQGIKVEAHGDGLWELDTPNATFWLATTPCHESK